MHDFYDGHFTCRFIYTFLLLLLLLNCDPPPPTRRAGAWNILSSGRIVQSVGLSNNTMTESIAYSVTGVVGCMLLGTLPAQSGLGGTWLPLRAADTGWKNILRCQSLRNKNGAKQIKRRKSNRRRRKKIQRERMNVITNNECHK